MQILKSKKDSKGTFNEYVPENPHYQEISLDKLAASSKAYEEAADSFVAEQKRKKENGEKTATQELDEAYTEAITVFTRKYAPPFARPEYAYLTLVHENVIKWDVEALNIFIRAQGFYSFKATLQRIVEKKILEHFKVDLDVLDSITWKHEVDFYTNKFKEDYLKQLNGDS